MMIGKSNLLPGLALLMSVALLAGCGGGGEDAARATKAGASYPKFERSPHLAFNGSQAQILTVRVSSVSRLSIYERVRSAILKADERKRWWRELSNAVGFDPLAKVDQVAVGMHGDYDMDDPLSGAVIVASGDFGDPERIVTGLHSFLGAKYLDSPPAVTSQTHGDFEIRVIKGAKVRGGGGSVVDLHFALAGPRLVIFSRSLDHLTGCLNVISGDSPDLLTQETWRKHLAGVRLESLAWCAGDMPPSVLDFIREHVESDPDLKGLIHLNSARTFAAGLRADGDEYSFEASFDCGETFRATGLRDNMLRARENGVVGRALKGLLGEESAHVPVWHDLFRQMHMSTRDSSAVANVSLDRSEMDKFLRVAINPPPLAETSARDSKAPAIWNE